jgi:hypothetical protein
MPSVICPLSIVPVRKEANDRSEMVSQWLFGETAEVLERTEKWSRLRFDHDGYEGWVDNKQIAPCAYPELRPRPARDRSEHLGGPGRTTGVWCPYGGSAAFL